MKSAEHSAQLNRCSMQLHFSKGIPVERSGVLSPVPLKAERLSLPEKRSGFQSVASRVPLMEMERELMLAVHFSRCFCRSHGDLNNSSARHFGQFLRFLLGKERKGDW